MSLNNAQGEETSAPPAHSRTNRFALGLLSGYLVVLLSIAINLLLIPFALRFVSPREYAFFVVVGDVLLWLNLFDFGTTASLRAQVARLSTSGGDSVVKQSEINRIASHAFYAQLAAASLVFAVGIIFALTLPRVLFAESMANNEAFFNRSLVVALLVFAACVGFVAQTFTALLAARQQTHINNFLQAGNILLRLLLVVCFLFAGGKLLGLAAGYAVAGILFAALTVWCCFRKISFLHISPRLVSRAGLFGQTLNLALWFNLGNLAGILIGYLDRFVAATLVSLESVTTLTLTGRAYFFAGVLLTQLVGVAMPALGQLAGATDRPKFYQSYRRLAHLVTGASVVAAATIFAGNRVFVARWVGAEHYGGVWLDATLALALIAVSWTLPQRAALVADLVARPHAIARICEALLNLTLSVLLAWQYGLIGVVLSTTLAVVLTSAWRLPALAARRVFRISWQRLLADVWQPLLFPAASVVTLSILVRVLLPDTVSILAWLLCTLSVFLCGVWLLWRYTFEPELRAQMRGVFSGARRGF